MIAFKFIEINLSLKFDVGLFYINSIEDLYKIIQSVMRFGYQYYPVKEILDEICEIEVPDIDVDVEYDY